MFHVLALMGARSLCRNNCCMFKDILLPTSILRLKTTLVTPSVHSSILQCIFTVCPNFKLKSGTYIWTPYHYTHNSGVQARIRRRNRLALTRPLVLAYEIATFWADAVSGNNKCRKCYSKVAAQESFTLSALQTLAPDLSHKSLFVCAFSLFNFML